MRSFRFSAYVFGCLVLLTAILLPVVRGQVEPVQPVGGPAAGVTVNIDKTDGSQIKGTMPAMFPLQTEYGRLELNLEKVKTIDFSTHDGKTMAIVELADKHHLIGEPISPKFALTTAAGVENRNWSDLRELKIERPPVNLSLVAALLGLITLAVMEIVLGIDNIIFLAIVVGRLPKEKQPLARRLGLAAALGTRILLLFSLSFLLGLTKPVFSLPIPGMNPDARDISWRDIILLVGGAFLIVKSVMEMHHKLEEAKAQQKTNEPPKPKKVVSFAKIIVQIAIIDIVFSLDSVITAVGMVDTLWVMIVAMILAMCVMLFFAGPISNFVEKYPTIKVLALSFLILIGVLLVAEGLGQHVDKGYVYFAMAFGVGVELVNIFTQPRGVSHIVAGQSASGVHPVV
jgi:predicted tellurium resistance membrane protein TerC